MPVRLLVTGARGQLGTEVIARAVVLGLPVTGLGSGELDITDGDAVAATMTAFAAADPATRGVIVNCAAYTAVDAAESDVGGARAVNEDGPRLLAEQAARLGLGLIHVSTDYVFPGDGVTPYETDDPTGPRSVYGITKLAGEEAVRAAYPGAQVVRTSWVYGATGANFVKTMVRLAAVHPTITVVDDQRGAPTYAADLAAGLVELAGADLPGGVLHATGAGETTWWGFARAIFAQVGADPERVLPTTTAEFPRPAPRPAYSVLSNRAWADSGLTPLPDWRAALQTAFDVSGADFMPPPADTR